jgi:hypothetical protein
MPLTLSSMTRMRMMMMRIASYINSWHAETYQAALASELSETTKREQREREERRDGEGSKNFNSHIKRRQQICVIVIQFRFPKRKQHFSRYRRRCERQKTRRRKK